MKRLFVLLLIASMLSFGLAACSAAQPEAEGKFQILTMAVGYRAAHLSNFVRDYNAQSETYKIEIVEYPYPPDADRLLTEITAGKAPDLYAFSYGDDFLDGNSRVIYEDLLPYFEADPDYKTEMLVEGLYQTLTQKGGLYTLPFEFSITTLTGKESVFGERSGLTLEELHAVADAQVKETSLFEKWRPKDNLFSFMCDFLIDDCVDLAAGTCDFNQPGFLSFLEACNEQQTKGYDEDLMWDESHLLFVDFIQSADRLVGLRTYLGEDYTFVGCPNSSGSNGASFNLGLRFSMSNTSEHKEGVWDFMRFVLSGEAGYHTEFFPAIQAELEANLAEYLKAGAITERDAAKFQRLLDETTHISIRGRVYELVMEEAGGYFSGQITAEQAVERLQSRVGLYLAEGT